MSRWRAGGWFVVLLAFWPAGAIASGNASIVGPGGGTLIPQSQQRDCGVIYMHADDVYHAGFAWSDDGVAPPYYGAFAECYSVPGPICGIVLDLTQTGGQAGQTCDLYVWEDGGGVPGTVLMLRTSVDPGPIAQWTEVSRHVLAIPETTPSGSYWVGYWGSWIGTQAGWYVGADGNSSESGCPMTNIAPDLEYPKGWQDVSVAFLPAEALGIGVQVVVEEAIGACCLPNHTCVIEVESRCTELGGVFQGSGVPCTPELCLPSTGACCLGQSCLVTTFDNCFEHDGRYLGDGSGCDPNPCNLSGVGTWPPGHVRITSWGRIKSILR